MGTEAIPIKGPQGKRNTTIKRADTETIQIEGPQREEKGDTEGGGG